MAWKIFLISIACAYGTDVCKPTYTQPCPKENNTCLSNLARRIYTDIITGSDEMGIPTSDPLYVKSLNGSYERVKYSLVNSTLTGFKECKIERVTILPNGNDVNLEMFCPAIKLTGNYEIDGEMFNLPLNGKGIYTFEARGCQFHLFAEIAQYNDCDGKSFLSLRNFKVKAALQNGINIQLGDLFHGSQIMSRIINYIVNMNRQFMRNLFQGPLFQLSSQALYKNMGNFLKAIPMNKF